MPENATSEIEIFISHSSADMEIAAALVELIRAALNVAPAKIRCSSVDGYRLPGGAQTDQLLKKELRGAKAFIGLLTKESLASTYVLFELGARWGAEVQLTPLIAGPMEKKDLKAPLTGLNAHSCNNEAELYQLLEELGSALGSRLNNTASYIRYVGRLVSLSQAQQPISKQLSISSSTPQKSSVASESNLEFTIGFVNVMYENKVWKRSSEFSHARAAVLTVTNEPAKGAKDLRYLTALVSLENEKRELWRLNAGCWLDHLYNYVHLEIAHSKELILVLFDGPMVQAIENTRSKEGFGGQEKFKLAGDNFRIKVRFMDVGGFLLDRQFVFKLSSSEFEQI